MRFDRSPVQILSRPRQNKFIHTHTCIKAYISTYYTHTHTHIYIYILAKITFLTLRIYVLLLAFSGEYLCIYPVY
jgi:hypothetical protein